MRRVLGLDLGTNSIGWALVNEAENNDEKSSIIKLGVRAIHFDTFVSSDTGKEVKGDPSDFFKAGKGVSPNAGRTQKRSARRNLQRYKLRREMLIKILKESKIITDDSILSEQGNFSTFETYRLRAKAVTEEITLEELARVLLMINKKRGYRSNRKAKGGEEGCLIDNMDIAKRLHDEKITPGEFTYEILKQGKKHIPDFYASDLQSELDKIWYFQQQYYPNILIERVKQEITGKKANQTWAILAKYFTWQEIFSEWDSDKAQTVSKEVNLNLKGIKRSTKGDALRLENYEWRTKALKEKMPLEELAIVFQEINKQLTQVNGYLGAISDRSKVLYFDKLTVGQYMLKSLNDNPNVSLKNMVFYRQDYLDEFNRIWETQSKYHIELTDGLRKKIRDEAIFFQRRLKSQKELINYCEFESDVKDITLADGNIKKISIGSKVIPRSSPLFQEFKIWQILNNVEVFGSNNRKKKKHIKEESVLFEETEGLDPLLIGGRRRLYPEEMEVLAKELSFRKKLTKQEALSMLFDDPSGLNMNFKTLDGNQTGAELFKAYSNILELTGHGPLTAKDNYDNALSKIESVFDSQGWNTDFLTFDSNKKLDSQKYYKLWHLLYSFESDNTITGNGNLIKKITDWTGMPKEYASILANITFLEDYGSLSAKAISNILPHLKDGNQYDVACEYAGYRHSKHSLTKEEIQNKTLKEKLENLPKNSLRNPIVEKILNQMVNVVNAVIDTYGKPDEIRVELARELKKGAKERASLTKSIEETTKLHQEYKNILQTEFGLAHISRNDIIRYKLYEELKDNEYKTLYSNTYIPREKLFSGEFDIEHIIPKARLFDDSLSNKTIELKSINIEKGKMTAIDYVHEKYGNDYAEEYIRKCETLFGKDGYRSKLKKLLMKENDIPDGFIERDLRNTQYIARTALQMLNEICRRVVATTGSITDKLREDWQLVDMMKELNWKKYEELGLVEYKEDRDGRKIKRIKDWTKRNDHRHHAMDALTVAFTKDVFIQYFNHINASHTADSSEYAIKNKYFHNGKALPPIPLDEFRSQARKHMQDILISIKPKGKVVTNNLTHNGKGGQNVLQQTPRGQLHLETVYGKRKRYATKVEKVNASFTRDKINMISKKAYRIALNNRLDEFGGDPKKAFAGKNALDKNPVWIDDMHTYKVPEKVKLVFFEEIYTIRKPIDSNLNIEKIVDSGLRKIIKANGKDGLFNLDENPIWQNKEKNIKVKAITITGISNAQAIHDKRDKNGNLILDEQGHKIPNDYVNTGNNHHVAIYKRPILEKDGSYKTDEYGNIQYKLDEQVVSFYEAVMRANDNKPVIDKHYREDEGWKFMYSMKQNEYFVFPNEKTGFDPKEIDLMDPDNYFLISPNLFRVQKFSTKDYVFRHHLETTVEDTKDLQEVTWKRIVSMPRMDTIVKVRINHIGNIVSVGEY